MTRPGKRQRRPATEGPTAAAAAAPAFWLRHVSLTAGLVALVVYLPRSPAASSTTTGSSSSATVIRDLGAIGTVLRYEPARPLLNLTWASTTPSGARRPGTTTS